MLFKMELVKNAAESLINYEWKIKFVQTESKNTFVTHFAS